MRKITPPIKTAWTGFRLTEYDFEFIKTQSAKMGLSMSDYIRLLIKNQQQLVNYKKQAAS